MALILDHEAQALARLIEQYKGSTNIENVIKAIVPQTQDQEPVLDDLQLLRFLGAASGEQLDGLGRILDTPRAGLSDTDYRGLLTVKIAENFSEGTIEDLIGIFNALMDATKTQAIETFPAAFQLTAINGGVPILPLANVRISIERAKPAGVGIGALIQATADPFVFDGDPDGFGFDDGEFSQAF